MTWDEVVARVMDSGKEHPAVQLELLIRRLEQCPEAIDAIADAVRDMGLWYQAHADALEAEGRRRNGGAEIVALPPK